MSEIEDLEELIAELRSQLAELRKKRMNAQKIAATSPLLQTALERTSRDRSSGATDETDALREEILKLRSQLIDCVKSIDNIRGRFLLADEQIGPIPQRPRLVSELNDEAEWRRAVLSDDRTNIYRLVLPESKEMA